MKYSTSSALLKKLSIGRIILIWRNDNTIVPSGGTTFQAGDKLLVLANKENRGIVNQIFKSS